MSGTAGTIVVGVDGSESSHQALAWAAEQAQAENRILTLVHAVPRSTPILLDPTGKSPQEARDLSLLARVTTSSLLRTSRCTALPRACPSRTCAWSGIPAKRWSSSPQRRR